jgi:signal transduction histidine kinase
MRSETPRARPARLAERVADFVRALPERARERSFWVIQAQIVAITLLHALAESTFAGGALRPLADGHLPEVLYAIPITYAGFQYGLEGGTLTALWAGLLVIPSEIAFHHTDFEWLGDALFILVVCVLGVLVALPLDRERFQRHRAEATARRLALLNEVSAILAQQRQTRTGLDLALGRLVEVVGLQGACVVLTGEAGEPEVQACVPHGCVEETLLVQASSDAILHPDRPPAEGDDSLVATLPLQVEGRTVGSLGVLVHPGQSLSPEDSGFLAAAASEIGAVADNARLRERERERLQTYVRLVVGAQEDERARISRELHDETAQELVVLCRELDALIASGSDLSAGASARLQGLRVRARQTLEDLRRFGRDLRPALLDDLGLAAALEWLVDDMGKRTMIEATLEIRGSFGRLPPEVEVALFRITQEALRNVERHALASRVTVAVDFDPHLVQIAIQDNGTGFQRISSDRLARLDHLGLLGMEERARLVGAEMSISSEPGTGTQVTVRVGVHDMSSSVNAGVPSLPR